MCPLREAKSIFYSFRCRRIKSYLCQGRSSAGERSAVAARNKKKGVLSSLSLNFWRFGVNPRHTRNKNSAFNNLKAGRETEKPRERERIGDGGGVGGVGGVCPDRYVFIFLWRRYHLKGFLITTTRQKLLGFLPDPLNDKISLHSLSFLISAKHLGASSPKYRRMNVKMPFRDAGVTFDKKLLD